MDCPKCKNEMELGRLSGADSRVAWVPEGLSLKERLVPFHAGKAKMLHDPKSVDPIPFAYRCPVCTMIVIEKSYP